ncbi:MAG: TIGR03756 family integrating conjugative element protein [Gammaproteobacteria bacterium]|nr:TIGR03756 family integrating conjugative element protein [Gammaproteobacteria bacterium]
MKTYPLRRFIGATLLTCLVFPIFANADTVDDTINSAQIIQRTLQGADHCFHYRVVGVCEWLVCHHGFCHPTTSLKLDHYLPDVVVSVFTHHDNNPWWLAQNTFDPALYQTGQALFQQVAHHAPRGGDQHANTLLDMSNRFHEVDIIGNPALLLLASQSQLLLPSTATAYQPYYSSLLDSYAWRFPAAERFYPGSITPGLHDVGMIGLHNWGPVYPRNGYVNQPDDAKAAAVNALRASTIITAEKPQLHIYQRLSNNCGNHCQAIPVKENSQDSQYQMIYPKAETTCTVFGGNDVTTVHPWEYDAPEKGNQRYLWVLWRHYRGCIPVVGGKYIGSMSFH